MTARSLLEAAYGEAAEFGPVARSLLVDKIAATPSGSALLAQADRAAPRPVAPAAPQRPTAAPAPSGGGMTVGEALEAIKAAGIEPKAVSAKGKELYGQWSWTYAVTLAAISEADAIAAALALARQDEFSVVRIVDTLRAGDGWQVILEVTPLRGSLDPAA